MASNTQQRDTVPNALQRDASMSHRPAERAQLEHTPFNLPGLKSYPGGKGAERTVRLLINEIPPHTIYGEPFLGGGAIMRHKLPATEHNYGFDLSDKVLDLWRSGAPAWVQVRKLDAFIHLDYLAQHPDTNTNRFLFIDPPYRDEITLSKRAPYVHRMPYHDHVRLLDLVQRLKCNVMVCHLPNELYSSELKAWRTFTYQNVTHGGLQTEQVWMNYAEPERLHDYRYLGADYREREYVKRATKSILRIINTRPKSKAQRPALERRAILEAIMQADQ